MSTPGRRKALKSLSKAKKSNKKRIQAGKSPVIGGKKVSLKKFVRETGATAKTIKNYKEDVKGKGKGASKKKK